MTTPVEKLVSIVGTVALKVTDLDQADRLIRDGQLLLDGSRQISVEVFAKNFGIAPETVEGLSAKQVGQAIVAAVEIAKTTVSPFRPGRR